MSFYRLQHALQMSCVDKICKVHGKAKYREKIRLNFKIECVQRTGNSATTHHGMSQYGYFNLIHKTKLRHRRCRGAQTPHTFVVFVIDFASTAALYCCDYTKMFRELNSNFTLAQYVMWSGWRQRRRHVSHPQNDSKKLIKIFLLLLHLHRLRTVQKHKQRNARDRLAAGL